MNRIWHFGKLGLVLFVALCMVVNEAGARDESQERYAQLKAVFRELLAEQSLYEHPGDRFSYEYVIRVSVIPDDEKELEFCMIFAKALSGKTTLFAVVPEGKSFREQLLGLPLSENSSVGNTLQYLRKTYRSDEFPILKKYALAFEHISLKAIPPSVLTLHATEYEFEIDTLFERLTIHLETVGRFDDPCSYNALFQWLKEIRTFLSSKKNPKRIR